jgi:hypothetical protein
MAHDAKYGRVVVEREPGNPLGDDEPVFLLRGRDSLTPRTLNKYADFCSSTGSPAEHVASIRQAALRISRWQDDNPDLVKQPD